MAKYPDWVMKHKKKGTYINQVNGKYYLYTAHSERVPGTKKVKRVFDGYIGRITEEEGLIPTKDKVTGAVIVYEYGLSTLLLSISKDIHKGFKVNFKNNADFIIIAVILSIVYGNYNNYLLQQSYLSIRFPEMDMSATLTDELKTAIERGIRMVHHGLLSKYNSDADDICNCFCHLYKVQINNNFYMSKESHEILELKKKYKIEWSD